MTGPPLDRTNDRHAGDSIAALRVSFAEALRYWLTLGFINFGGPAGQIALMHRDLVERRRWISEERFLHALNYCMLLPGPEAQQLAIYIGWLLHGTWGGVIAGIFFVLPSIFVLLMLSYIYAAYGHVSIVTGALAGVKPVVVAIVVDAVVRIAGRALKRRLHGLIAVSAFVLMYLLHIPFPLIVLCAGVAGWLSSTRLTDTAVVGNRAESQRRRFPTRARTLRLLAGWLVLSVLPFLALVMGYGWGSLYTQVYRFFTLTAFVTFGGAYAVLAYVSQAAVESYGWLSHAQAVDGLALAETTPGPLIMVLQFVGFMAGWNHPPGIAQVTSAALAALVTTYATFLPCFFFIFLGAPYIEVLRGNTQLNAALSGITAAVVGVILNLAFVFGSAVTWPQGVAGGTDWFAVLLGVAAFGALSRCKLNVLCVVLAGGVMGLGRTLLSGE